MKKRKEDIINALTKAQQIAFAPLTFQAIAAMIELGILKEIDTKPTTKLELKERLQLSDYAIDTLLEVGLAIEIIKHYQNKYIITKLGQTFLYDEMTRVNFNFVKDVCYAGAANLSESFKQGTPCGLKNIYKDSSTIYPHLSELPIKMRNSWSEFDHYYSDNCFDIIYEIIKEQPKIFDIGGNMGALEKVCLKNNPNCDITMIDLPKNIDLIKDDEELQNCKFLAADILDESIPLPTFEGCVVMSQFLDCFSKDKIEFILQRIKKNSKKNTKIYILEPFIDNQKFTAATYSLVHTSLYFTCMANGYSKMYSKMELEEIIQNAGMKVNKEYQQVGAHDYTLLECVIND